MSSWLKTGRRRRPPREARALSQPSPTAQPEVPAPRSAASRKKPDSASPSTRTISYGGMPSSASGRAASGESSSIAFDDLRAARLAAVGAGGLGLPHPASAAGRRRDASRSGGSRSPVTRSRSRARVSGPASVRRGRGEQLGDGLRMAQGQLDRLGVGLVAQAVVAEGELGRVELVRHAVEDQRAAGRDGQAVDQLQRLLDLRAPPSSRRSSARSGPSPPGSPRAGAAGNCSAGSGAGSRARSSRIRSRPSRGGRRP